MSILKALSLNSEFFAAVGYIGGAIGEWRVVVQILQQAATIETAPISHATPKKSNSHNLFEPADN